jgi:hypothetical protein
MRRLNPTALAAVAIGLLVLLAVVIMMTRSRSADQDKLSDAQAAGAGASAPAKRCASQATYDRIKLELFRRAAQVRTSDQAVFDRLSAYASVRMERPVLRSQDRELGTVRCAGRLSLDLPPGVAVVGGRRTLSADVDYVLQPAADGSGDVVILEGADPIIIPLATLARTGETAAAPEAPSAIAEAIPPDPSAPPPVAESEPPEPATQSARAEPAPPPAASAGQARPSFNCRYARTRGEIAVCRDPGLAALDRQMAAQFYRALRTADPRQRATLTATRDSFLRFRDRCPTNACVAETYRGRMREIRDIMSGDWRPGQ